MAALKSGSPSSVTGGRIREQALSPPVPKICCIGPADVPQIHCQALQSGGCLVCFDSVGLQRAPSLTPLLGGTFQNNQQCHDNTYTLDPQRQQECAPVLNSG